MKPDLVGYVLGLLNEEERRAAEEHLEHAPDARDELAAVRAAVEPLSFDAGDEAPPGLFAGTLQRIAAFRCRRTTPMPATGARHSARFSWRRADLLVAASIVFILCLLIPPALLYARQQQEIAECSANLHRYYNALSQYSLQQGHDGYLPHPQRRGPFSAAAFTNVALHEAGLWEGLQPVCPANRRGPSPVAMPKMEEIEKECQEGCGLARLQVIYERLGGCYGYSLGFEDQNGQFVGVRRSMGGNTPILSDRPPRDRETAEWQVKNSPNHGGLGQNVLYLGGQVRFLKTRRIGDDDLFLNAARRLAAGQGPGDAVLAPGEARPYPEVE